MPLAVGSRIGAFQITALIGAGGMGEVYRATDTRLGREVAIKVLPAEVASDAERLARFRREAQLLAQLNHPNIAAIHGLEEADGTPVLVLELVEGEDLAARLRRGPIPLDEATAIAARIAEGLEEAHDKGIVHRDLKPANVKVAPDGKVKILDFGLAKAFTSSDGGGGAAGAGDLSRSPTLMQTAGLAHSGTRAGIILGTAAYMAPEQARGRPVDRRADIWAFGVVLWEILTGRALFGGETLSDVLAAVLTRDPEWGALPKDTPAHLVRLLRRCLERDPRRRLQAIGEARLSLEQGAGEVGPISSPQAGRSPAPGPSRWLLPSVALLAAALGAAAMYVWRPAGAAGAPAPEPISFEVDPPAGNHYVDGLDLSRDGKSLVFAARDADGLMALWIRPLDTLAPRRLEGTEGARFPFWSPDARQVGFFANSQLKVIDLVGGAVRTIARTSDDPRGGAWGAGDVILFASAYTNTLLKISASGGATSPATEFDPARKDGTHRWPSFLPDGRHFFFYASPGTGTEPGTLCLGSLDAAATRTLAPSQSNGVFLPPHSVVFAFGKALVAQDFDPDRLTLAGSAVSLGLELPGSLGLAGFRYLSAAAPGTLVYRQAPGQTSRLVWADRSGKEMGPVVEDGDWHNVPQIAPDGRRVATAHYGAGTGQGDIVVHDPDHHVATRVTYDDSDEGAGYWSRDGKLLAIWTATSTDTVVSLVDPSRPGSSRVVYTGPASVVLEGLSPDGGLLLTMPGQDGRGDIYRLPPGSDKPVPVVNTPFSESSPSMTDDGQWLAYVGDSTGRSEVYVRSMTTGEEWRLSKEGGRNPLWRRDGKELFYLDERGLMMLVPATLGKTPTFGTPEALFQGQLDPSGGRQYDVTADGQRFVLNRRNVISENPIVVRIGAGQVVSAGRRAP
jgi:Tol biopolymer transport system component